VTGDKSIVSDHVSGQLNTAHDVIKVFRPSGTKRANLVTLRDIGHEPGPLFCPVTQRGDVVVRPMTDQAIYAILQSRAAKANVKAFSPHDLRRSCVSDLLDAGVDISVVQRFVGHANVTTTARYDRRGEQAKKKAAKSLHVPFVVDSEVRGS